MTTVSMNQMGQLVMILLEAAIETVPMSIANHPAVIKTALRRGKKPTEILLDASLHYHAMKSLPRSFKRGRPDIVHISLLEALESPLCKRGYLRVIVHTIEGHAIFIDPSTRLPKNYNRFVGLMEQLFKDGQVPPGSPKPLIYLKTMGLKDLLKELSVRGLILLDEKCDYKPVYNIVSQALSEKMAVGIGAFPRGDFEDETRRSADQCYSMYEEPLATHIVVSRTVSAAESAFRLLELKSRE